MENNYYSIACEDLKFAVANADSGFNNNIAVLCQQSAEKFLKAVIEVKGLNKLENVDMMRTHNLKVLYRYIKEAIGDLSLDITELAFLNGYYFEARYPGYDFIVVTKEEAKQCLDITEKVKNEAERLLGKSTQDI